MISTLNRKRLIKSVSAIAILSFIMVLGQNCSGGVDFATLNSEVPLFEEGTDERAEIQALVYGSSAEDRQFLAEKIAGYLAPSLGDIFNRWRRIAGNRVYNSASEIVPDPGYEFCHTSINPTTGNWNPGFDPVANQIVNNPGSYANCIGSAAFAAASWVYMPSSNRLRIATNAGHYNGFISAQKFDQFVHQAVLTSNNSDDDTIGLIIAAKIDESGNVHTLSALRTHGGNQPANGWAVVYQKNGAFVRKSGQLQMWGDISVGGVNKNDYPESPGTGDFHGWNNRKSLVRVERDGDHIVAYASEWGLDADALQVADYSKIEIDLSDASNGLEVFRGKQFYGYSSYSQLGSEYLNVSFTTATDGQYVFDLPNRAVYEQRPTDGGYSLRSDLNLYDILGVPRYVVNPETQRKFHLNREQTYTPIAQ